MSMINYDSSSELKLSTDTLELNYTKSQLDLTITIDYSTFAQKNLI